MILALVFGIAGGLAFWLVLWLTLRYAQVPSQRHPDFSRHSLIDEMMGRAEAAGLGLFLELRRRLFGFTFHMLDRFLPVLRSWTRGMEERLEHIRNAVRGHHELGSRNKENTSAFLRDIREHAEQNGKGVIHE